MTWLDRIGAELDKIEGPDDDAWMLTKPDSPQYLKNAERQLANATAPSFKWKPGDTFTAARLGALLGHKIAYVKPFVEGLRLSSLYKSKIPPEFLEGLEEMEKEMLEYHPVVLRTARRCLGIAMRQPLKDVREFLSGLTRALEKGSLDSRGGLMGATTATEFYWFLLLVGPRLQYEVRSLNHMHQVCRRLFGQRAGDLKTTEKRCQRIKLSFGKQKVRSKTDT
jgi:hypothetical protein